MRTTGWSWVDRHDTPSVRISLIVMRAYLTRAGMMLYHVLEQGGIFHRVY
jgi:hypothetical protein